MKRTIKWIIIVLIVLGIGFTVFFKMNKSNEQMEPMDIPQAIPFEVIQETITNSVQVKGKSKYEQETLVYAPFASKVTEWKVENGGQVKEGDVLYILDQSTLKNEIALQEATNRKAKLEAELNEFVSQQENEDTVLGATEAERLKALAAQETGRLSDELNKLNADIQKQELAEKKTKLKTAVYKAPATGIFLYDSTSERPQSVTDNQYIGKIVDMNKLEFIALVGEQDIFRIKEGMKVIVKLTALKELQLSGEVTKVSKFAVTAAGENNTNQVPQFEVVISLQPDEHLIGGLSLNGEIETVRKEKATVVSSIAVIHEGDISYVMLDMGNGQYERRDIEVGMETADKTEILSGLNVGDTVVLQ
ncbi:efflux RND transporter periplasmic adaptor subunit [Paenibacillus sp. FA6]|uniref:efflux RND transporter periplasmic adaptor subunit n=1 Tax=Paenibacillus sp. FA6 TaxID=3413029 RepID=UPI003F65A803